MNRTTEAKTARLAQLEDLCAWLSADGVESSRVSDAEMAWLTYYLSITLAANLRRRLDLSPVQREDAIDAAHDAATKLRHVQTLLERLAATVAESMEHRYEPPMVPPFSRRVGEPVDLGGFGVCPEATR